MKFIQIYLKNIQINLNRQNSNTYILCYAYPCVQAFFVCVLFGWLKTLPKPRM